MKRSGSGTSLGSRGKEGGGGCRPITVVALIILVVLTLESRQHFNRLSQESDMQALDGQVSGRIP